MKFLQKLGKSLMLPIAVLPICGILMGLGYLLCPNAVQAGATLELSGFVSTLGFIFCKVAGIILDNIGFLFVIGVAVGMSDDNHGSVAISGLVSWLILTNLLSPTVYTSIFTNTDKIFELAFQKTNNPFIGIIAGLIAAFCYNKYKNVKFPDVLAFFSGRRFVAIATVLVSMLAAGILFFAWPFIFSGMVKLGEFIAKLGGFGAAVYAFFNRLLIPTGLHHALNNVFWFDTIGLGDLTNFWAGKTSADVSWDLGSYMSGFFPCFMFGIPGASLAMYHTAKNKKKASGKIFPFAICSFFCGLTEPFEFSFLFTCFPLFVVYSVLTGLFTLLTYFSGFRAGFSFSAGIIDLIFSAPLPAANKTWMIIPLGIAAFVVYYFVFRFVIVKFDLKTPGREDDDEVSDIVGSQTVSADEKFIIQARAFVKSVGGVSNVVNADCCATRLRLQLNDTSLINKDTAKKAGALGVMVVDKSACQIIVGMTVQQVCDAFNGIIQGKIPLDAPAKGLSVRHGDIITIGQKGEKDFTYVITDPVGIHARPAGEIVKIIKTFDCSVTFNANGKSANGSSLIELMSLGVVQGTEIKVTGDGPDAVRAVSMLKAYIEKNL